jgi:hypothetical protein
MQDSSDEPQHYFPTHPAYLIPVEIKDMDPVIYGEKGHRGVFTTSDIPKGTKEIWVWTDRVIAIHHNELDAYIEKNFVNGNEKDIQIFLRQGFVLPPSTPEEGEEQQEDSSNKGKEDDYFYSNPTDAGRFVNHSNEPNIGMDGALRDISAGEELVMGYSYHGNPIWYQNICSKYNVLTEAQVVQKVGNKIINSTK